MSYIRRRFPEASVETLHDAHSKGALFAFEMGSIRASEGQDTSSADKEMAHCAVPVLLVELLLLHPPRSTTTTSILPENMSHPTTKSSHRTGIGW